MNSQRLFRLVARLPSSQVLSLANQKVARLSPIASTFCTHQKPAATTSPAPAPSPAVQQIPKTTSAHKESRLSSATPSPALLYGLSGLIPFVAVPVYTITAGTFCPLLGSLQLCYGASILSFLGGVRWGNALRSPSELSLQNLGLSVVPSLVACAALAMPYSPGMLTVAAGLGGVAYLDIAAQSSSYPQWFKSLRLVLSSVAVVSLLSALLLSFTHKQVEKKTSAEEEIKKH